MAKVYDDLADFFYEWAPSWRFRRIFEETVLELIHGQYLGSKARILEMGCGHGTWIKYILDKADNPENLMIEGIDISGERIRLAKSMLKSYDNVTLEVKDILKFTSEKKYDIIFFAEVLCKLNHSSYEYVFGKCYELLGDTGYMVIIDKDKYSFHALRTYVKLKFGLLHAAYATTKYPSFKKLVEIAKENDFQPIKTIKIKEFRALVLLKGAY